MSSPVLVIDTSYLLELYQVPSYSSPEAHKEVKARFAKAIEARSLLVVPFPSIFEVANHIVDGRDEGSRVGLAQRFVADIEQSFTKGVPFLITPALDEANLRMLLQRFAGEFAAQRVGLTDTSIVEEAQRLKQKYGNQRKVHIWTKDHRLKAREPDVEPSPFVT
ncbi:hypothetical protein [Sorangium sp. So ce131]|uniref:hypothetical protein n=1 Tax=Sorangium sp. So ce131 TaxID=3133282 RepID=UPI003F602474